MIYLYQNYTSEFISEPTKYSKYYFLIIERALRQSRIKLKKDSSEYVYYENHHIIPKSLFPEYSNLKENPWNSVLLTAREHYLIHALIWKHFKSLNHPSVNNMAKAFYTMNSLSSTVQSRYNSKLFEKCKISKSHTNETKLKISIGNKLANKNPETIKRKSLAATGRIKSEEEILKIKISRNNRGPTKQVTRDRLSESCSGSKNGNAKHILIFNSNHEIMFDCLGTFYKIILDLDLPRGLIKTLSKNSVLPKFRIHKHKKYEGWYARYA